MLTDELFEKLADAQAGKYTPAELAALEAELAVIPGAAEEAAAYRELWAGLAALRSEEFRAELQGWENEAAEVDDEELAEWYRGQKLHPALQAELTQRISQDNTFAQIVTQQDQLEAGFTALATEELREQMGEWEQASPPAKERKLKTNWLRPLLVAAGFALLFALGGNWWGQSHYSNDVLASKYYKLATTGNTMGAGSERAKFLQDFDAAHTALKTGNAEQAIARFEQLSQQAPPADFNDGDIQYYQDNIEWNYLLARLADDQTGGNFPDFLDRIIQNPAHLFHAAALDLQADLGSFWRMF